MLDLAVLWRGLNLGRVGTLLTLEGMVCENLGCTVNISSEKMREWWWMGTSM